MRFEHAEGSGRVRLDREAFEAITGDDVPPPPLQRLMVDTGAASYDGEPAPDLVPLLAAVRGPWCVLHVEVSGGAARQQHRGWVQSEVAALLLQVSGDTYDLFGVLPEAVPAAIARVVRLGPRKQAERAPTGVTAEDLTTVWEGDLDQVAAVLDGLGGREDRWCWRAEVVWPDGEEATGRGIAGMAGPEGWWLLREDDAGASTLMPTTPTTLWTRFIGLLPSDAEVEASLTAQDA